MQSRSEQQLLWRVMEAKTPSTALVGSDMEAWLEDIESLLTPLSPVPSPPPPPPPDPSNTDLSLLDDLEHLLGPWGGGTEKVEGGPCALSLDDLERLLPFQTAEDQPENVDANPGQALNQREFCGGSPGIPGSTELSVNGVKERHPSPPPSHRERRRRRRRKRRREGEVEGEVERIGRAEELERENRRLRAQIEELAFQVQETRRLLIDSVVNCS
ncbi:uncharacterized protein LOC144590616 [Rhinoraja longicauda]